MASSRAFFSTHSRRAFGVAAAAIGVPSALPLVVDALAECRGLGETPAEIARATTQNALEFFGLDPWY